jgi:DNA invertase Pin-like site-specific DNA recombinase
MAKNGKPVKQQKAYLYARFSPRRNEAECESCDAQLEQLRAYCTAHGLEAVAEFHDDAISGADKLEDRPALFDLLRAVRRGGLVLVTRFDRWARDTYQSLSLKAMVEVKGARLLSISEESACEDTPESRLMASIFMSFAAFEREMIVRRTAAAMRRHQANGRRMSKEPPFGWKRDKEDLHRIVPDEAEQATLALIRQGAAEGKSAREIARHLNQQEIPCRTAAGRWSHKQIIRILRRDMRALEQA